MTIKANHPVALARLTKEQADVSAEKAVKYIASAFKRSQLKAKVSTSGQGVNSMITALVNGPTMDLTFDFKVFDGQIEVTLKSAKIKPVPDYRDKRLSKFIDEFHGDFHSLDKADSLCEYVADDLDGSQHVSSGFLLDETEFLGALGFVFEALSDFSKRL